MKQIELSTRELILLALMGNVTELVGIPDAFLGLDEQEIELEFSNIQVSLDSRGLASLDFNGEFTLQPEVVNISEVVYSCTGYFAVDGSFRDEGEGPMQYYIKDKNIVRLENIDNRITITRCDREQMQICILEALQFGCLKETIVPNTRLSQKAILQASQYIKEDNLTAAEKSLAQEGCSKEIAEILIKGFKKEGVFNTALSLDFSDRRHGARSLVLIGSIEGTIVMDADSDDSDIYDVSSYINAQVIERVKLMIDRAIGGNHD